MIPLKTLHLDTTEDTTLALLKINANFNLNYATVGEENGPVPKKLLLRQKANIENGPPRKKVHLRKLKDGKVTWELELDNSANVTCFTKFINVVDLKLVPAFFPFSPKACA